MLTVSVSPHLWTTGEDDNHDDDNDVDDHDQDMEAAEEDPP